MRKYFIWASLLLGSVLTGCANVAVQDTDSENYAKEFNAPPSGWAGLYLYRTCNIMGMSLKKSYYSQSLQSIKIAQCHTRKGYPEVSITGTSRVGKIEILLVRRSCVEFRRSRRS